MTQKGTGEQTGKGKPLRLEDVQRILAAHEAELKAQGVKSLAVFGSVARGDAGPDSDVDLIGEFERPFGLFKFVHVKEYLETGISQIKPTFLDIAPSGIPSNLIPHSKGVKCGLIHSNSPLS